MTHGPIPQNRLREAYRRLVAGEIDRRQFMAQAGALGLGAAAISMIVQNTALAQDATPRATPAATLEATGGFVRPDSGTEGQTRSEGGELRILVPQGASALSVHNATGGKDIAAGSIISEPLLAYAPDTSLVANLVTEVPSFENGLLASDLSSVTFNLLPGVLWSDGQPFTADDVVFTWEWNVDEANGSIDRTSWELLSNVEAVDELTVLATFGSPTIGWFQPFGSNIGVIYPRHFWDGKDAAAANLEFAESPIGTGAFVLESLAPNDQVIYLANESYREPNKPFFSRVIIKGGGDAPSAVRAVTSTADWDLAFTLQIDSTALEAALGDQGAVYGPPGTGVEKIQFNFSDPNTEVDGQRSQKDTPHPFLTDKAVRQAISLAINRQVLSDNLYAGAPSEPPGRNILAGMDIYDSPNTTWEFNPEAAAAMLDEAGWVLNGNVREKDGMRLSLKYVTTTAEVRQKVQAVVKDNLVDIGFDVELVAIEGGTFFDGSPGNEQNFTHFYSDMQEYTDGATSAFPVNYMKYWYAGPDGENIAQAENDYTGTNKTRYSNTDYDAAFERIAAVATQDEAIALFIELNDHVINEVVEIPLVQLVADRYAASNEFNVDNIAVTAFGDVYWNIANWNRLG
ncbi:MAG: peptide ABC transporter substrate-binding protein [Chloroflexota bacterium]|nr:peptide ABC transporter substrate-binding protein [Chloroflexota bacterium]